MTINLRQRWIYTLALVAMVAIGAAPQVVASNDSASDSETASVLAQQIDAPGGKSTPLPGGDLPRLEQGMNGTAVQLLQVMLRDLDFYSGAIDGNFGPVTANAVRDAQGDYGLKQDAVIGSVSWPVLLFCWDRRLDSNSSERCPNALR